MIRYALNFLIFTGCLSEQPPESKDPKPNIPPKTHQPRKSPETVPMVSASDDITVKPTRQKTKKTTFKISSKADILNLNAAYKQAAEAEPPEHLEVIIESGIHEFNGFRIGYDLSRISM